MKPPFLRTPYNYDRDDASDQHALVCKDPSLTKQEFKDDCNLNLLYGKYLETGEMPQVADLPQYGNFTGIHDFQTAMNAVAAGKEAFLQLPHKTRSRFENDPQKLLEFLADPENDIEAIRLGLKDKPKEPDDGPTPQGVPTATTQKRPGTSGTEPDPTTATGAKKP